MRAGRLCLCRPHQISCTAGTTLPIQNRGWNTSEYFCDHTLIERGQLRCQLPVQLTVTKTFRLRSSTGGNNPRSIPATTKALKLLELSG